MSALGLNRQPFGTLLLYAAAWRWRAGSCPDIKRWSAIMNPLKVSIHFIRDDRKRYTGTKNGMSLCGLLRLQENISFPIPSTGEKSTGIPFYGFFREVLWTHLEFSKRKTTVDCGITESTTRRSPGRCWGRWVSYLHCKMYIRHAHHEHYWYCCARSHCLYGHNDCRAAPTICVAMLFPSVLL